jgi:hypothetical protein
VSLPGQVRSDWRWAVVPLSIAVVSRLYSILLILAFSHRDLPFLAYDGQWYVNIAENGYHRRALAEATGPYPHFDFAFHPAWPLLIRIASLGGLLDAGFVAVVLANLLLVAAAVVLYRLFVDRFGESVAGWGVVLLCFNPIAFALSMAYSEPLFLLVVGLSFLARFGKASPPFALIASLTRIAGLAIIPAALANAVRKRRAATWPLLTALGAAAGFGLWYLYIWRLTGDPFGWFKGSLGWNEYTGVAAIEREFGLHPFTEVTRMAFVLTMLVGALLLLRRHLDLALYSLAAVLIGMAGAGPSMARYAEAAFPVFAALASRLGRRGSLLVLLAFGAAQVVLVSASFGPSHRPP